MITDKEINAFIKQRGIKLKGFRRRLKITQQQLSIKSGLGRDKISKMENGKYDYKMASYFKYIQGLKK